MREAIARAEVGDDVANEDPTTNRLQERLAAMLGKEAALYVPSGTMSNQIAVGIHARPGDELICDPNAHVYLWEGGGIARLWGVTPRTIAQMRSGPSTSERVKLSVRLSAPVGTARTRTRSPEPGAPAFQRIRA